MEFCFPSHLVASKVLEELEEKKLEFIYFLVFLVLRRLFNLYIFLFPTKKEEEAIEILRREEISFLFFTNFVEILL